jgi:hypothetical protein
MKVNPSFEYTTVPERVIITGEDQTTRPEWSEQIVIGIPPAECQPSAKGVPDEHLFTDADKLQLMRGIIIALHNARHYLTLGERDGYLACIDQANSDLDFILTLEKDAEVTP